MNETIINILAVIGAIVVVVLLAAVFYTTFIGDIIMDVDIRRNKK